MTGRFLASALLLLPLVASASTLYKCTDSGGHTTYTNTQASPKNCTVLSRERTAPAASTGAGPSGKARPAATSPADFPRVSADTQKNRDTDRRRILEQEMSTEQRHLDDAQRALREQEAQRVAADRLHPYRDRIALHERNLDALRREMSNLR